MTDEKRELYANSKRAREAMERQVQHQIENGVEPSLARLLATVSLMTGYTMAALSDHRLCCKEEEEAMVQAVTRAALEYTMAVVPIQATIGDKVIDTTTGENVGTIIEPYLESVKKGDVVFVVPATAGGGGSPIK